METIMPKDKIIKTIPSFDFLNSHKKGVVVLLIVVKNFSLLVIYNFANWTIKLPHIIFKPADVSSKIWKLKTSPSSSKALMIW